MNILFLKLLNMSISAGWLVLAVLVLRLCLKKAPKWVSVLLWGIVAIRLILPFSIESVLSLIPSVQTVPMDIELSTAPAVDTGVTVLNNAVNPILAQSVPSPGASVNPMQVIIAVCANVWLLGVAVMALYTAISYLRLRRRVRTAIRLQGNIYQSEQVDSPFVLGLLFPRIYLPFSMDAQALSHVIAHENAHIRRKDHWWKPLGFLLLTLHWFNPLMWLAYILLCRDIELACDEKVIKELGCDQRADYTQALLSCSINRKSIAACPLAFGEVGVKERVKSVMKYKKPAFWIIVAAIAICAVVAVCFLTDPVQDDPNEPHSGEVTQRIDEALEKKIRKAMYLPDSQVLTYAGEYSQEPYTLLWVCYEIDGMKNYEAVSCEQSATGELKFKDICHVTTYTADIFHTFWMGEDIYLVNNPNCKQIINRSGDFRQEVPIDEDEYPYVYRALPMESPWTLTFADADGNDLQFYSPEQPSPEFDFLAEVLEVHDDYLMVKPGDGWLGNKPAMMEVPVTERNLGASPKPQVGDTLIISTDGVIQEIYPPRLTYVSRIRVVDVPEFTLPRMIMVNGELYRDTGREGIAKDHPKTGLGMISSIVSSDSMPTSDNQANFDAAYCSPFHAGSPTGTIELNIDGTWWLFANEEVFKQIQTDSIILTSPGPGERGSLFVYDGTNPSRGVEPDLSECVLGALYYLDLNTGRTFLICREECSMRSAEGKDIYFVKAAEPEKIYTAAIPDLSQHSVIYESESGPITVRLLYDTWSYKNPILYFVEDNKRFVVLDLVTKEATVLMEQYDITFAYVETVKGGHYTVRVNDLKDMYVYFEGRLQAGGEKRGYLYTVKTGEIQEARRL